MVGVSEPEWKGAGKVGESLFKETSVDTCEPANYIPPHAPRGSRTRHHPCVRVPYTHTGQITDPGGQAPPAGSAPRPCQGTPRARPVGPSHCAQPPVGQRRGRAVCTQASPSLCRRRPTQKRLCPLPPLGMQRTPRPWELMSATCEQLPGAAGQTPGNMGGSQRGVSGGSRQRKCVWGGTREPIGRGWGFNPCPPRGASRRVGPPTEPTWAWPVRLCSAVSVMKSPWRLLLPSLSVLDSTAKSLCPASRPPGSVVSV